MGLADLALARLSSLQQTELVLDVVADLVRDHVGVGEIAAGAELALHLLEEGKVDIDRLVDRAVERAHLRARAAAARARRARVDHHLRRDVRLVDLRRQHDLPDVLGIAEDLRGELTGAVVRRRPGASLRGALRLLLRRAAAHHRFAGADQDARIDAERPAGER